MTSNSAEEWPPERGIEQVLIAEHVARTVMRLESSGRSRDAALALLLRPVTAQMTMAAFDIGRHPPPAAAANWHALFDGIDDVPLSLLHALSGPARQFADDADWSRFEAALLHRDNRNLASWQHRLTSLRDDPPALDAWLRRAAQHVDRYESLGYEPVVLMVDALATQPMDRGLAELLNIELASSFLPPGQAPDEIERAAASLSGDRERWLVFALGVHMAIATPSYGDLSRTCSIEEAELRRARREACLSLIRRALPGASSLIEQSLLTAIWQRLVADTPEEAEAIMQRRTSKWQLFHGMRAVDSALDLTRWLSHMALPNASELSWVRSSMLERGISLVPPEEWEWPTASMP